ncbi:S41 family peptidase [Candidatus Omnitrophota bacterium]
MRRRLLSLLLIFSVIGTMPAVSFGAKETSEEVAIKQISKDEIFSELELFADAITLIEANYAQEVESKELIYGSLDGMLSSLDSHSSFLRPDDYKEMQTDAKGEFGGVGIKITLRDKIITVVSPLEGTPAYKAGVAPGDRIIKIDGESTKDFTLDDTVKKLRGAPGTKVKITVLREEEEKLLDFTLKRAIIKVTAVKNALILDDDIGYVRITDFQQHTGNDLAISIKKLLKQKMRSLILDLRSNPGGLLSAAILVSEKFLKRGDNIVSTKGRIKEQNMDFKSKVFMPYKDFPITILVNKGSASAAEIVAGALRDNKRALLVGEKTFGKGSVQTVIPMNDGSALRLTTSHYYTPSGNVIHERGIAPDVEVKRARQKDKDSKEEDAEEEEEGKKEEIEEGDKRKEEKNVSIKERLLKDNQVQAAIELLKDRDRYASLLK